MENVINKGQMRVGLKNENGFVVTKDFGFTVEEENGAVLGFDLYEHPELGTAILFGNQVFLMRFWSDEHLEKATNIIFTAVTREKERRRL
jgi:hypothetical protein